MTGSARVQRVLAFGAIALVGLSVLALLAVLLAPTFGVQDATQGVWPFVYIFPLMALPVAFLMFAVVIGFAWFRRKN